MYRRFTFIMVRIKNVDTQWRFTKKNCLYYTGGKGCEPHALTYGFQHVQHVVFNEIINKNYVQIVLKIKARIYNFFFTLFVTALVSPRLVRVGY